VDDAAAAGCGAIPFAATCDATSEFDRGEVADGADDGAVGVVADFGGWVEDDTDADAVVEAGGGAGDLEQVDRGWGLGAMGGFFGVGEPGVVAAVGLGGDRFVAEEIHEVYAIVGLALDGTEVDLGGLAGAGWAEVVVAGGLGDRFWGSDLIPNQK
jgi:hypothetical protein